MRAKDMRLLQQGVAAWNAEPIVEADLRFADLSGANLSNANLRWARFDGAKLSGVDFRGADLSGARLCANLTEANLSKANLSRAYFSGANLSGANLSEANCFEADLRADLSEANLRGAQLIGAYLDRATLINADLTGANFERAKLSWANLHKANLSRSDFSGADLSAANLLEADFGGGSPTFVDADLSAANLRGANLSGSNFAGADLRGTNLSGANLSRSNLRLATLVETVLYDADLTYCQVYGVSAWGLQVNENTRQENLVITSPFKSEITVDKIEVAQFVHLLLHNEKIRDVIDTIGTKGVLLLGRFTEGRIAILERLRDELRKHNFVPLVFNFDKPETKGFTETVRLLAGLSRFVIADITNPRSAPLELQATVPECMVPFVPILDKNEEREPFAMLRDLQSAHPDRVLDVVRYPSVDRLIEALDTEIIAPAQARVSDLSARKREELRIRDI